MNKWIWISGIAVLVLIAIFYFIPTQNSFIQPSNNNENIEPKNQLSYTQEEITFTFYNLEVQHNKYYEKNNQFVNVEYEITDKGNTRGNFQVSASCDKFVSREDNLHSIMPKDIIQDQVSLYLGAIEPSEPTLVNCELTIKETNLQEEYTSDFIMVIQ